MTRFSVLTMTALLAYQISGKAHALDEYRQATRLDFARDHVRVELSLTPGVAVAAQVFALIDRDADSRISPIEIEDYALRVLRDLSLRVDDHQQRLRLIRAESASWEETRDGEGTIRIQAVADVSLTRGRYRIRFENMHEREGAGAFLVNALAPADRDLEIRAQRRDVLQHSIEVDLQVAPWFPARWWLVPVAAVAAILIKSATERTRVHSGVSSIPHRTQVRT